MSYDEKINPQNTDASQEHREEKKSNHDNKNFWRRLVYLFIALLILLGGFFSFRGAGSITNFNALREKIQQHEERAVASWNKIFDEINTRDLKDESVIATRLENDFQKEWLAIRNELDKFNPEALNETHKIEFSLDRQIANEWISISEKLITGLRTNNEELLKSGLADKEKLVKMLNTLQEKK